MPKIIVSFKLIHIAIKPPTIHFYKIGDSFSLLACMQAAISGLPSSMLTGEVIHVGVDLFTVGQMALNSLRLTSSLG